MANFTPSHRGGSGPPLLCIHGFTDTWRSWELVLPALERKHDVLAPTLAGHAGGPPVEGEPDDDVLLDGLEQAMDEAGFATAHIAGNSLGGYLALRLAARGRAESVVALAPGGGWRSGVGPLDWFLELQPLIEAAAPNAEQILATDEGRRRATAYTLVNYEHVPADLLAHQMRGAAGCTAMRDLVAHGKREGFQIDAEKIDCPVRVVWGSADRILTWPDAATRYREDWAPNADWVVLDDVGHCPQLDVPTETAELITGFTAR